MYRFLLVMLVIFYSSPAYAFRIISDCKHALINSDVVILGQAISGGSTTPEMIAEYKSKKDPNKSYQPELPNSYSDFEVLDIYKGAPAETVRVYYTTYSADSHRMRTSADESFILPYSPGAQEIIYARFQNGYLITSHARGGMCSGPEGINEIKAEYDALEDLIKQSPQTAEFYLKKVSLLEDNKDYAGAVATFQRLFAANRSSKSNHEWQAQYGRDLQLSGNLDDALKVLGMTTDVPSSATDMQLSLIRLGRAKELNGTKLAISGQELSDVTIANADLSNSDFSGSKLKNVKFLNVKLNGANFSNSEIQVEFSHNELIAANFESAKVRGDLLDNNFNKAKFNKADLLLGDVSRNNFTEGDFSDAKLHIMGRRPDVQPWEGSDYSNAKFLRSNIGGIGNSKIKGADFSDASFYTGNGMSRDMGLDLSHQKLDGIKFDSSDLSGGSFKGSSLRNASFTGSNLSGVDFSDADLTGADFTVSPYTHATKLLGANFATAKIDGAKWEGAIYDCKTTFPQDFDTLTQLLEPVDPSCSKIPPADITIYSKERFSKGYIKVCNGDYHASCIYGFIIQLILMKEPSNYYDRRTEFLEVARSLIDAGSPELARMLLYRTYAEHYEVYGTSRPIGSDFFSLLMESGGTVNASAVNLAEEKYKRPMRERKSSLRDEALSYLKSNDRIKARESALKGLERVSSYVSPDPQTRELLLYADIVARTEGGLKPDAVKILENMIRTTPYVHAHNVASDEPSDYVAKGETLLKGQ